MSLCVFVSLYMCLCVWMLTGHGTNRNRCTQRLVILHAHFTQIY